MALTMTRTRTQTALTSLAQRVALVHGELSYLEARMAEEPAGDLLERFARRRNEVLAQREALYLTIQQFDPELDPSAIGEDVRWIAPWGRGARAARRYEASLGAVSGLRSVF